MCTIENNYIYNSTFNLFYAVYDTKNTHTGTTNSAGKSFSTRNDLTLVAVGEGLVAQSNNNNNNSHYATTRA
jgi:hypothetical protein